MRGVLHFLTGKETLHTKLTLKDCAKVTLFTLPIAKIFCVKNARAFLTLNILDIGYWFVE